MYLVRPDAVDEMDLERASLTLVQGTVHLDDHPPQVLRLRMIHRERRSPFGVVTAVDNATIQRRREPVDDVVLLVGLGIC